VVEVLRQIEENSDFRFFFLREQVDVERKVTVTAREATVEQILEELFRGEPVSYEFANEALIVLTRSDNPLGSVSGYLQGNMQQPAVSGTITDESGQPLPGVTVVVKGTTQGTVTNANGNYSITNIPENATLVFSFVGMRTQEVLVGNQTKVDVTMEEDVIGIEEVVAVGYGVQKKENLTGAVTSVGMEEIANRPTSNFVNSLQGMAPGIFVNSPGGQPGADLGDILIRGIGSFQNSSPLIIMDGVTITLQDMASLNPNDIKNISILKDAASAAIYGSRAANGVILITSKEGKNQKAGIRLDSYYGFQSATVLPELVNAEQYTRLANEARINGGQAPYFSVDQIALMMNDDPYDGFDNVDWIDQTFRTAPLKNTTLTFNKGNEKLSTTLSLGYLKQDGIMIKTGTERFNFRGRTDYDVTDFLKIGINLNSYRTNNDQFLGSVGGTDGSMMRRLVRTPPSAPVYYQSGGYFSEFDNVPGYNTIINPLRIADGGTDKELSRRIISSVYASIQLAKGLNLKTQLSYNYINRDQEIWNKRQIIYDDNGDLVVDTGKNALRNNSFNREEYQNETFLTYEKLFAYKHDFKFLAGYSFFKLNTNQFSAYGEDLPNNTIKVLNATSANFSVSGNKWSNALESWFGRVNYIFNEKYLFEGNVRYDGSSRFSEENRWGVFPSFSAGWIVSKENFLSRLSWLDHFKIRGSWGLLGNQNINDSYPYIQTYDVGQNYLFGPASSPSLTGGIAVTNIANNAATWESTETYNIGIDATFFRRLNVNFDYFDKITNDVLIQLPIPGTLGNVSAPYVNDATIQNKGWEGVISYQNNFNKLIYNISFNISSVKNEIIDLKGQEYYPDNRIHREDEPFGSWYGLEAIGIFKTEEEVQNAPFQHGQTAPGDIRYADLSGPNGEPDGIIDSYDRTIIGNSFPEYMYGFNLGLNFKGFDANAFFQGVQNVDIYSSETAENTGSNNAYYTWTTRWLDRWTPENPDSKLPRLRTVWEQNELVSSFWLEDASYLRLKNIEIGYTLPNALTSKLKISKLRLYAGGQNLFTWTKLKNYDPEKRTNDVRNESYPQIKVIQFGVNCEF
jgi:TonB-linked SusC/RagA family outer membrane protein